MRPTTRRILTATISAVVLLSACSSGDDEAEPTTPTTEASTTTGAPETTAAPTTTTEPTPTTAAPTTTTTPESTTTTTPPPPTTTQPPPTTNPADPNWANVVQGLYDLIADLWAEPDVSRIDELCFPGENSCRSEQGAEIEMLANENWRVINVPDPQVLSAVVTDRLSTGGPIEVITVSAELAQSSFADAAIVDSGGEVVQSLEAGDGESYTASIQLIQDVDGEWKATGFATLSE